MNRRFNILLICILLLGIFFCYTTQSTASEVDEHPISKWLAKELEKDSSTAGMREAYAKAYEKWDKELNRVYKELMSKLSKKQQESLRTAQANWLKYRDAEYKAISDIVGSKEGTMWLLVADDRANEIIGQRVVELTDYLEIVNDGY